MKGITWALAAVVVVGLAGCSGRATPPSEEALSIATSATQSSTSPLTVESPAGAATPPANPRPIAVDVEKSVQEVARSAVAAAVVIDCRTGDTMVSENADRPFHTGSLVKLLIGLDALMRHPGDEEVYSDVARMIKVSDDPIASAFWVAEGGSAIIARMRNLIGLSGTKPPVRPGQWGDTMTTANDIVKVYDYLMTKAPAVDRETIVNAMAGATAAGSDGFKQHFGIPSATKQPWAVKQAWTNNPRQMSAHSTGFVGEGWHYTVVLLTEHPVSQSWTVVTRSVTAAAVAVAPLLD